MNIKIVSHLQSWVSSIGSSHKNSFDVLSIKQMKIENRIKEMLSITDVSSYYERYKEDANKLNATVCNDKYSKNEIQSEKRKLNKKLGKKKNLSSGKELNLISC